MSSCDKCKHNNKQLNEEPCVGCTNNSVNKFEPMTRGDWIRSLSDEDLARFLNACRCEVHGWCDDCGSIKGDWCYGIQDNEQKWELRWLRKPME